MLGMFFNPNFERNQMGKQLEYFDELAKTQKQVFNNLLNAQKNLRVQWLDVISKTQAAFTSVPGLPDTPQTKEALNQFNTWFSTVANSSHAATEEALKTQEYWINVYEMQLAVSRETLRGLIEVANQGKSLFSFARPAKEKDKPVEASIGIPAKPETAKAAKPVVTSKTASAKAVTSKPTIAKAKTEKPATAKLSTAKPKSVKNSVPEVFKTQFKKPTKK